jgi:hypothetical protein
MDRLIGSLPRACGLSCGFGYSLTDHENGPAPAEATGLEVDKLNRQYIENYVDGCLKTYSDTVGPALIGKAGIGYMLSDSAETGAQNWTDDMLTEFCQRRGYDAHVWPPVLTGVIVQSPQASDKFLWDFDAPSQNFMRRITTEDRRGIALPSYGLLLGDDMKRCGVRPIFYGRDVDLSAGREAERLNLIRGWGLEVFHGVTESAVASGQYSQFGQTSA